MSSGLRCLPDTSSPPLFLGRIVWGAVNTFNMRSMFTEVVAQLWYTNHLAISIASNLLILLYWYEFSSPHSSVSLSSFSSFLSAQLPI